MRVTVSNLSVDKGGQRRLHRIEAVFAPGRLTVLIGPNGAGKSTLLRTIAGLETPAGGQVLLDEGGDAHALPPLERARRLAWVPDHTDMPFAFTVLDTVVMGRFPWHQGAPRRADTAAAMAALARLGIASLADRALASLSSGERQKAHVARALAGDAACLLLDEPCANLDIGAALRLLGLLGELAAAGRTVVLTLHDLALAHRFAGSALCLWRGRVVAAGEPAAVFTAGVLEQAFGVQATVAHTAAGEGVSRFAVEES